MAFHVRKSGTVVLCRRQRKRQHAGRYSRQLRSGNVSFRTEARSVAQHETHRPCRRNGGVRPVMRRHVGILRVTIHNFPVHHGDPAQNGRQFGAGKSRIRPERAIRITVHVCRIFGCFELLGMDDRKRAELFNFDFDAGRPFTSNWTKPR